LNKLCKQYDEVYSDEGWYNCEDEEDEYFDGIKLRKIITMKKLGEVSKEKGEFIDFLGDPDYFYYTGDM